MNTKMQLTVALMVGIIVGIGGVIVWQNSVVQSVYDEKDSRIGALEADIEELIKAQGLLSSVPKNSGTEPQSGLPVAVFVPAGRFTPEQKTAIEERLIEPLFDYHNTDSLYAATMQINYPNESNEFTVAVIFTDGSNSGFLYGDSQSDDQPWWSPECLGECVFTNAFRGKYPEIVNASLGL